jgi:hypothetical protein
MVFSWTNLYRPLSHPSICFYQFHNLNLKAVPWGPRPRKNWFRGLWYPAKFELICFLFFICRVNGLVPSTSVSLSRSVFMSLSVSLSTMGADSDTGTDRDRDRQLELSRRGKCRSVRDLVNDAGTYPAPEWANSVWHFLGLIPDWNEGCLIASADVSFLDADAQLCL